MAAHDPVLNPAKSSYTPAALVACRRTLATLVKRIGAQRAPRLVVVGGLVPHLLFENVEIDPLADTEEHPGTNDVDFCVQLEVPDGDEEFYQALEQALKESEFVRGPRRDERGQSVWRWVRTVDDVPVAVEFLAPPDGVVAPDGGPGVGRIAHGVPSKLGDEIGALRIPGAALAYLDAQPRDLNDVELLDGGGIAQVRVWVASLLPFIALKSFAARHREKDKDPFDLVWVLNRWPGGPEAAAKAACESKVASAPDVAEALTLLAQDFQSPRHEGCVRYARFQVGRDADVPEDERMGHARYAHGTVAAFLREWKALVD